MCYDMTSQRIGPCKHALCASCAATWCARDPTCPYCRQDVFGLVAWRPVVAPADASSIVMMRVSFPTARSHAGITVINEYRGGVRVKRLHPKDCCYAAGLRGGMVITAFNGVPCTQHEHVTRMFDVSRGAGADAVLTVRVKGGDMSSTSTSAGRSWCRLEWLLAAMVGLRPAAAEGR